MESDATIPRVKGLLNLDGKPMYTGDVADAASLRSLSLRRSPWARESPAYASAAADPGPSPGAGPEPGAASAPASDLYSGSSELGEDEDEATFVDEPVTIESINADLMRSCVGGAVEQIYPPPDTPPASVGTASPVSDSMLPDAPGGSGSGSGSGSPPGGSPLDDPGAPYPSSSSSFSPAVPIRPPPAGAPAGPSPAAPQKRASPSPSGPGSKRPVALDDFEILRVIGKGSFATVLLVRKRDTGELHAMKVLAKAVLLRRRQVAHTRSERSLLQHLQHPFIVGLRYAFQTPAKVYLVMEYMRGGELFFHLKREYSFPEHVARFYAAEIALALGHLHSLGIIYRDLKPENVLLDGEGHVRLTDLGLAKRVARVPDAASTFCGTAEYMAPEVIKRESYGMAADWWAFGCLLYEMLVGALPFYSASRAAMQQKVLTAPLKVPPHVKPAARDLLQGLLERDAARRLGSGPGGPAEVLEHAWFAGVDWSRLLSKEIRPPFKPLPTSHPADTANFDSAFTSLHYSESPSDGVLGSSQQGLFDGFSYNPTPTGSANPLAAAWGVPAASPLRHYAHAHGPGAGGSSLGAGGGPIAIPSSRAP
eukprot:tig00021035_g17262.t1